MNRRNLRCLGLAAALAAGCADDVTEPSGGASVQVAQGVAVEVALGDTVRLSASVLDGRDQPVPGAVVRWTSADPTVARVDASGLVAAVAAGSTTVTATVVSGASAVVIVTVGPIRKSDARTALTVLYEATDGPNWTANNGWLTDQPLGRWHGVDTDGSGRVVVLRLNDNDLTGEIPPELGNLASLEDLDLRRNLLTGEIPPELGNLANLGFLRLNDNNLTGEIPPELGNLASLQGLNLHNNALTGEIPAKLGDLASLSFLRLSANNLTGEIPPELGDLASLSFLRLSANNLTGEIPPELGNLASLETLRLSYNALTSEIPAKLSGLSNLKFMYWFNNAGLCAPGTRQFIDFAGALAQAIGPFCHEPDAATLEALYSSAGGSDWGASDGWLQPGPLSDWYGVETDSVAGRVIALDLSANNLSGALPASLLRMEALKELRIDDNGELGGRLALGLTALSLRTLRYDGTNVCAPAEPSFRKWLQSIASHMGNGIECPPLADRDVLEVLYYSTGGANWNAQDNWMTAMPLKDWHGVQTDESGRVVALRLGANNLTGEIPPELGNLANLEELRLDRNNLTGEIPPELGNLANLGSLRLYANNLTGEIPPELGNLAHLAILILDGNNLTGEIPPELGNLSSLYSLELSNNALTGEIPPELGNLDLLYLFLSQNALTGEIPEELGNLSKLRSLAVANNAGMSGMLPAELTSLDLRELLIGGTRLCAPRDADFQSWLRSIPLRRVSVCAERVGGEARAAAYVVQAVQSFDFPVPLVAGRPGLLRVFAWGPQMEGARVPTARATFYLRDGSERTIKVPSGEGTLRTDLQEGSFGASANVEVPADVLQPGVEMVVDVDPEGTLDPGLGVPTRIPTAGRTALEVYELPPFDVTVVPFLWRADPDSSILDVTRGLTPDDPLFETTQRALPVGAMSVTVHEPVWSSSNSAFVLLRETLAIRTLENGSGYWMGTLPHPTGAAGVASPTGQSMFSVPGNGVIAHEFGHNFRLWHAPCGAQISVDWSFPDDRGRIGAWGWNRRSGRLLPPVLPDLMSYCGGLWLGDYHFARSFRWRMHDEAGVAAFAGPPTRVLLLWGGADADGKPFLNPSFVVDDARASLPDGPGEWRIVGEAEDGRALFDRAFDMAEIADGDGRQSFVFALPAEAGWADALARIVLTGPGGTAELDAESGPAAALLLDPATGNVRGILRDWPDAAVAEADAAAAAPEPGLQVQVSRGVPAPDAWRR